MKSKQIAKWCWGQSWFTLAILFGVLLLLYTFYTVYRLMGMDGGNVNGNDMATFITLFILGIVLFGDTLRFGLLSGVSRKSVFLGLVLHSVVLGVVSIAGNVIVLLLDKTGRTGVDKSGGLFEMTYRSYFTDSSPALVWVLELLWIVTGVVCVMAVGMFVGGVFYRLGRIGRICWAAGLPVGLFAVLPVVISVLPESAQLACLETVNSVLSFFIVSPFRAILAFLVAAVAFSAVNWLLIRRAPLK